LSKGILVQYHSVNSSLSPIDNVQLIQLIQIDAIA